MFKDIEDLQNEITNFEENLKGTDRLIDKVNLMISLSESKINMMGKFLEYCDGIARESKDDFDKTIVEAQAMLNQNKESYIKIIETSDKLRDENNENTLRLERISTERIAEINVELKSIKEMLIKLDNELIQTIDTKYKLLHKDNIMTLCLCTLGFVAIICFQLFIN